MNWLSNFIRPKIRSLVETQKEMPDNLWTKCPSCEGMLFQRDLVENKNVCNHCNHHLRMLVEDRLTMLFDDGKYTHIAAPRVPADPLKFKDRKKYADRIKDARDKRGRQDAIVIAHGQVEERDLMVAAFDFDFMGGSMGTAVGEAIVKAAEEAVKNKCALLIIPSSGGARMQEGALSLMQMPRTIIATQLVREAGLPYFVLLTDPTTGGVSASFAMVGDIQMAEPGAMIGFAGKRVIQETIREELPEDFQTAEYLLKHGMIDMIVPRNEQREMLAKLIDILTSSSNGGKKTKGKSSKKNAQEAKAKSIESESLAAGSVAKKIGNIVKLETTKKTDAISQKKAARG